MVDLSVTVIDGDPHAATNVHETCLPDTDTGSLEKGTTSSHGRTLAAALALVLVLAGCAPQSAPPSGVPTVTLEESRQQLLDILDAAVSAAGGEWNLKTERAPSTCSLASGEEGEMYSLVGTGPGTADPAAVAEAVATAWRDLGYDVHTRDAEFGVTEVRYERDATGLYFSFGANDRVTDLDGTSACVPTS